MEVPWVCAVEERDRGEVREDKVERGERGLAVIGCVDEKRG
jgi:hypothetical protein